MLLAQLMQQFPKAVLSVTVEYYTGMVDTVAHIPDRCYVAGGYEPTRHDTVRWSAFESRPNRSPQSQGDACFITFEDQTSADARPGMRRNISCNVSYFFHVNGEYASDPLGVRLRLQNLRERYGYYSKIELMSQLKDGDAAAGIMNDFLGYALPEVEKCLPDWKAVTSAAAK